MREFAHEQGIEHYYEVGCAGIEHALLPEKGVVVPGDLTIGADSHTCTYGALGAFSTGMGSTDVGVAFATGSAWFKVPESIKVVLEGEFAPGASAKDLILHIIGQIGVDGALYQVLEFAGPAVAQISMDGRFTMCNMAIEAGAKTGIFAVDDVTRAYVEPRAERPWVEYASDEDARYARTIHVDVSQVAPTVSLPHLPSNTKPAADCNDMCIDQAVIGSCTNGRIEDMRVAAEVLRGRVVNPMVRCIIIPATQDVYRQCMHEGLLDVFLDAHCAVSTTYLWPLSGRVYGRARLGRTLHRHDQPQFRRSHGGQGQRGHSRESCRGRRECCCRLRLHARATLIPPPCVFDDWSVQELRYGLAAS